MIERKAAQPTTQRVCNALPLLLRALEELRGIRYTAPHRRAWAHGTTPDFVLAEALCREIHAACNEAEKGSA